MNFEINTVFHSYVSTKLHSFCGWLVWRSHDEFDPNDSVDVCLFQFDIIAIESASWNSFKSVGSTNTAWMDQPPSKRQKTQSSAQSNLFLPLLQSPSLSDYIMEPVEATTSRHCKSHKVSPATEREKRVEMSRSSALRAPKLMAVNALETPSPLAMSQSRVMSHIDSLHSATKTLSVSKQCTGDENGMDGEMESNGRISNCTLLDIMKGMDRIQLWTVS